MKTYIRDDVSLEYHLLLEERKTISATLFPNLEVPVKAPLDASAEGIDSFLSRKVRWLLKQKRYFAQFKDMRNKRYVSGETFQYRGRSYKLLLHGACTSSRVLLQYGVLNVFITGDKHPSKAARLVDIWYSRRALAVFTERLEVCFRLFNYSEMPSAAVRRMSRRWGSYSQRTNRINLNRELIRAATRYIDYVIVHELCHITHRKHDTSFYAQLESILPNWKRLKKELELRLLG